MHQVQPFAESKRFKLINVSQDLFDSSCESYSLSHFEASSYHKQYRASRQLLDLKLVYNLVFEKLEIVSLIQN